MEKMKRIIRYIIKGLKMTLREGVLVTLYFWNEKKRTFAAEKNEYEKWIEQNEKKAKEQKKLDYQPLISVVIPVYNVPENMLVECIESIFHQTYMNWQLCLADDNSSWESMREILKKYEKDPRVRVVYRKENGHISRATNSAIELADGEFIAFMDCDDLIPENALYEVALKLNENPSYDFIYTDEDKIDEKGEVRWEPHFKPDWSPDTLMTMMYTSHLGVYRTSIVKELGGLRVGYEGSQDYDFTLRFVEKTSPDRIAHIPKVLYHWRQREGSTAVTPEAKPYVFEASRKACEEAIKRRHIEGKVDDELKLYQAHVTYYNSSNPLVSIIIPSKDNFNVYKRCVDTLHQLTEYANYEIIHVDNGSNEENRRNYENLDKKYHHIYMYEKMEFNFSKMCNIGAEKAKGEFLLFLNDDIEIFKKDWLSILVGQASLDYVGAVGAKLYYPNSTIIQHCGIINIQQGPVHMFGGCDDKNLYYFGRNRLDFNVIAVTGACLMVDKMKFQEIGGFDEKLAVTYNDVDLCFKLLEHGYYNVIRNDAILYHHESISRGNDVLDDKKMKRLIQERENLYKKHPKYYYRDPFYSPNLSQVHNDFRIYVKGNGENKPTMNHVKKIDSFDKEFKLDSRIRAKFDCISIDCWDYIFLQGYAFFENRINNNKRISQLLFEGETETLLIDTNKIYRPDLRVLANTRKYVNLTGWNCYLDSEEFHDKKYIMRIILDGKLADVEEELEL